jgi:hypothetical protein
MIGDRPGIRALAKKLGFKLQVGGHVFEKMLDPERVMVNGRSLWETHPDWFGLATRNGVAVREKSFKRQFCVSNTGLREFINEQMVKRLSGEWRHADVVYVWGFDTTGLLCECGTCVGMGNGSDVALRLLSSIRSGISDALRRRVIDRDVQLSICAYEGTGTLIAPTRPYPENLRHSGDYMTYYPINRCYAHDLSDPGCSVNAVYLDALLRHRDRARMAHNLLCIGEYWNVKCFDDLPLVFGDRMQDDLKSYHEMGLAGVTYMHVPFVTWSVRTASQGIYARLLWDSRADIAGWKREFFDRWYGGDNAADMSEVMHMLEDAWRNVCDWRSWSSKSVLSRLSAWDGATPDSPLSGGCHIGSPGELQELGNRSVDLMRQALSRIETCVKRSRYGMHPDRQVERRLLEDRRCVSWGIDCMALMVALAQYHESLRAGVDGKAAWSGVEVIAERLTSYVVPLEYEMHASGFIVNDALTRTRLGDAVSRCRIKRHSHER